MDPGDATPLHLQSLLQLEEALEREPESSEGRQRGQEDRPVLRAFEEGHSRNPNRKGWVCKQQLPEALEEGPGRRHR